MDDGLQNPQLGKDLTLAVVDGSRGLGNGRVLPAGPLRAPLGFQLALVDALVVNAADPEAGAATAESLGRRFDGPVLRCTTGVAGDAAWLKGQRVVAWAGIGAPQRFFAMLRRLGAEVAAAVAFRDHEVPGTAAAWRLLALADGARRPSRQHREGPGPPRPAPPASSPTSPPPPARCRSRSSSPSPTPSAWRPSSPAPSGAVADRMTKRSRQRWANFTGIPRATGDAAER